MQMEFLQAQIPFPKSIANYKNTIFSFDVKQIHPIDQMDLCRQSGELLFSTMSTSAMPLPKLRTTLSNAQSQLKIEKMSSLSKDNKLRSLEDIIIKIGYDPQDCKESEEILQKKHVQIIALKKQLKLTSTEDPQTKEMVENEQHTEDMLKLIIEKNI